MTPWQLLDQFARIQMLEVWFKLRAGGSLSEYLSDSGSPKHHRAASREIECVRKLDQKGKQLKLGRCEIDVR